jgi:hypothetical protein
MTDKTGMYDNCSREAAKQPTVTQRIFIATSTLIHFFQLVNLASIMETTNILISVRKQPAVQREECRSSMTSYQMSNKLNI